MYQETPKQLEGTMKKVLDVSEGIGMELGLKKCAVLYVRVMRRGPLRLRPDTCICELEDQDTYRYLGVSQLLTHDLYKTKGAVKREYKKRERKVWGTGLSSGQARQMHNSWSLPTCRYFFGVVQWSWTEVKKLDVESRKIMRQCKAHYLQAAPERLYLPTTEGGRGLKSVANAWEREVIAVATYLCASSDPQVQGAVKFLVEVMRPARLGIIYQADQIILRRGLSEELPLDHPEEEANRRGKALMRELEKTQRGEMSVKLKDKRRHGIYARQREGAEVDQRAPSAWLREGKLAPGTVAVLMAAQDQMTMTKGYLSSLPGGPANSECRLCGKHAETVGHLLSKCPVLEFREYKRRHDCVLFLLVRAITESMKMKIPENLKCPGGGVRSGVIDGGKVIMLVDQCIPTDRQITERRPDLVVRMGGERKIVVYEVACAWDRIVEQREREKQAKYGDLAADLARQWQGYRVVVIPVVIGDLCNLRRQMKKGKLLNTQEIERFAAEAQREVLCWAVKILK